MGSGHNGYVDQGGLALPSSYLAGAIDLVSGMIWIYGEVVFETRKEAIEKIVD